VLLVDCVPKLNFSEELLGRINQQAQKITSIIELSKTAE
jgi:hypothetical protein